MPETDQSHACLTWRRTVPAMCLLVCGLAAFAVANGHPLPKATVSWPSVAETREQRPSCPPLDSTAKWALVNREWSASRQRGWSNDSLRRVLLALKDQDQADRRDLGARVSDTAYLRRLIAQDSARSDRLLAIIDRSGFPTRSIVGPDGADAAMLIVQHAVLAIQERVLALTKALPRGELSPQALAMLEDRVLEHQGQPQRYGTQFTLGPDGVFRFAPTADVAGLAARRERAGLPPLDFYVCSMEEAGMRIDRGSLPRPPR